MSILATYVLQPYPESMARKNLWEALKAMPDGMVVEIKEPTRSVEQNSALWPLLKAWSDQKDWPVNGQLIKLTPEDWKDILTAAFDREEVRIAQGLDGGMVLLGHRTSKFGKRKFSAFLEWIHAASALHGIQVERIETTEPTGRAA